MKDFYFNIKNIISMWYKIAKQGSLWSSVSPTFEQDVEQAFNSSVEIRQFNEDDVEESGGILKLGEHKTLNLWRFREFFKNIPNNPLKDYMFYETDEPKYIRGGYCSKSEKIIAIGVARFQQIDSLLSLLKHEIIHAIEGTIPGLDNELYSQPDEHSSKLFKNYSNEQTPLGRKELEEFFYKKYLDSTGYNIEEAKRLTQKALKELERRSKSMRGDIDLYMANPSELRAFRAEFDNVFSFYNLKKVYHEIYEKLENGKEIYLNGFHDLIQKIANIGAADYYDRTNSFFSNLARNDQFFKKRFEIQVVNNLNPQYVRQMAKYLVYRYFQISNYLSSYNS